MRVEVVVPWRGGCPYRETAWEWLSARYAEQHLDWNVVRAPGQTEGPWCKALAVVPALMASEADIVVVADADCWTDGLQEAVDQVSNGAPWAIPHYLVHRLSAGATSQLLAGSAADDLLQDPYPGVCGGGFVVAPRATLIDIPLDPRFLGWGQEDESWSFALDTLAGRHWRGTADLTHLFHPLPHRLTRTWGSMEHRALRVRYARALHDQAAMRVLVEEAHDHLRASEPALRDRSSIALG